LEELIESFYRLKKKKFVVPEGGFAIRRFPLRKYWFWFQDPVEFNAAAATFFSYRNTDAPGFKKKTRLTTIVNLETSEDELWNKMRKGFVRKQIEKGERNGIIIIQDGNFKEFKNIYRAFREGKNIPADRYSIFEKNGVEFSAYHKGGMIAGGIFAVGKGCVRAWALASIRLDGVSGRMREIVGQANRLVIWEAIKYFKARGFKIFDLGGIDPDSGRRDEKTLAEFKEAFGGERRNAYFYSRINSKILKFFEKLK